MSEKVAVCERMKDYMRALAVCERMKDYMRALAVCAILR